jgi:hypothetical protein
LQGRLSVIRTCVGIDQLQIRPRILHISTCIIH